jgi:glucoside 3-dehydrogenase (cytochrome c) hitch-hiker subunit
MSITDRINLRQDRRQWLKTSAGLVGVSVLPLSVAAAPLQEKPEGTMEPVPKPGASAGAKAGKFFTPAQHAYVEELSETIIPADSHSGGAKAAKVADYIDQQLRESLDEEEKAMWHEGMRLVDLMCQHFHGKSFVNASGEERIEVLKVLSDNSEMHELPEVRFFQALKHMTTQGYYTSKIGIHDELEYKGNRILQEYAGCDDQPPALTDKA